MFYAKTEYKIIYLYLPTIFIGSARSVTYISDNARFAIKMYSRDLMLMIRHTDTRINAFPKVPKIAPRTRKIRRKNPTPGYCLTNSNRSRIWVAFIAVTTLG